MVFYTSDGCKYEGMDSDTIIRLRSELNRNTVFITYEEYSQIIENQRPK